MPECITCGHEDGWHLHVDGPNPRVCNKPKCPCNEYEVGNA